MSDTQHSTTNVEHPNAETIQGLREVADWLEQHPELPKADNAIVCLRTPYRRENAREELTALAVALGDRAREREGPGLGEMQVEADFGTVRAYGSARIQDLRDHAPIEPDYEPILPVGEYHDDPMEIFS